MVLKYCACQGKDIGGPVDDYTVANATLTYDVNDTTEAYLRIENLADEDYQSILGYDAPGRGVFVGLRASF